MFANPLIEKLATFVRGVGIDVRAATLEEPTFLPGLSIQAGALLIDEARVKYPGDILHEAGHIAVSDPAVRGTSGVSTEPGDEMAAIAWSYAAARNLDLDPAILFHPDGYKGGADALIENFAAGRTIGVPLLQWYGMTIEPRQARKQSAEPYPHMQRWMR
jgi:hypothetical protein